VKPRWYAVALFMILSGVCAPAQILPRVAVLPLMTDEHDGALSGVGEATRDTLELVLAMIGRYELVDVDEFPAGYTVDSLTTLAQANSLTTVVFGTAGYVNGSYHFELGVFDSQQMEVTRRESGTAQSVFDVFDVADDLALKLVESFSNVRMTFGRLMLRPEGEGQYDVRLDGRSLGQGVRVVPRVLVGRHEVSVVQQRPSGNVAIFGREVDVREGATEEITFRLPFLTVPEEQQFALLDRTILRGWRRPEREQETERAFDQALAAAVQFAGMPAGETLPEKYRVWRRAYEADRTSRQGSRFAEAARTGYQVSREVASARLVDTTAIDAVNTGRQSAGFLERMIAPYLKATVVPRARLPMSVDGKPDDWTGIDPLVTVPSGAGGDVPGADLTAAYLCRDEDRLYVMMVTHDGIYSDRLSYRFSTGILANHRDRVSGAIEMGGEFGSPNRVMVWDTANNHRHLEALEQQSRIARGSVLEMSIPLRAFAKLEPSRAWFYIYDENGRKRTVSQMPTVELSVFDVQDVLGVQP